jgi:hypothetical protein
VHTFLSEDIDAILAGVDDELGGAMALGVWGEPEVEHPLVLVSES